jgi:hypothetical protein
MTEIKVVKNKKESSARPGVGRSGITSPYFDLAASEALAQAILHHGGGTSSPEQLAHWLGYKSTNSGTYMTRISAATKHFGLIESSGDAFVLTERAKKILSPVMPEDATNARVEAFLAVPLFAKVYEHFRGSQLPPETGLKNLFLNTYKVLPDRVAQAVRVFLNSAEQAGFFTTSGDRSKLIKPSVTHANLPPSPQMPNKDVIPAKNDEVIQEKRRVVGGDAASSGVDTAIIGLLRKLPTQGESWTVAEQTRFLTAFTHTIQFLYPTDDESN